MILKKTLSVLTAAALAVPCMFSSPISAIYTGSTSEETEEEESVYYIPDFPQEILDEFDIDWTGLSSNRHVENTSFTMDNAYNEFSYDGGYAMYGEQGGINDLNYVCNWHDCNNFRALQSMRFPLADYTDQLSLTMETDIDLQIKRTGELTAGPLLELNGGKDELFIIEKYTSATVFNEDEKIGSYTADGKEFDLYKTDGADESSPQRYYAVYTNGLTEKTANDTYTYEKYRFNISEHLANLKDLAGTGAKLDSYGILCEGKEGVGFGYFMASMSYQYFQLPEEEFSVDENGEPAVYEQELLKNLGGYRYSLHTFNSGWPITQDKEGRYHISQCENESYIIPRGSGVLTAKISEGIAYSVSSGKEFDGTSPLLDKDYRVDYEYSIKDMQARDENEYEYGYDYDRGYTAAASVWTLEPYVRIDYQEQSQLNRYGSGYIGTIELGEEKYELRSSNIYDRDQEPLGFSFNTEHKSYLFVHLGSGSEEQGSDTHKGSFPITALAKAAEPYGVEVGNIARITLNVNSGGNQTVDILRNDISVNELSGTQPDNNRVYVDVTQSYGGVSIDPYTFYSDTKGYMYGYENGLFSAGSDTECESSFECCKELKGYDRHFIDADKKLSADYKIENTYKDNYQFAYDIIGEYQGSTEDIYIIENSRNYDFENNFRRYSTGMGRSPAVPQPEFIKTYTAGGHTYDLYRDSCVFWGCFSNMYYETYVSIRQDQDDSEILEGKIDFKEHISNINEDILDRMSVGGIYLSMYTGKAAGTFKALKNDIALNTNDVPQIITGDFNFDARIDSLDVAAAKKVLIEVSSDDIVFNPYYMDINNDSTFNIADVVILQSYVLGKIKSLDLETE